MDTPTLTIAQTGFFSVLYRDPSAEAGSYPTRTITSRSRFSLASRSNAESKENSHDAETLLLNTPLGAFVLYDPTSRFHASPMALPPPLVRPLRFWRDAK